MIAPPHTQRHAEELRQKVAKAAELVAGLVEQAKSAWEHAAQLVEQAEKAVAVPQFQPRNE